MIDWNTYPDKSFFLFKYFYSFLLRYIIWKRDMILQLSSKLIMINMWSSYCAEKERFFNYVLFAFYLFPPSIFLFSLSLSLFRPSFCTMKKFSFFVFPPLDLIFSPSWKFFFQKCVDHVSHFLFFLLKLSFSCFFLSSQLFSVR